MFPSLVRLLAKDEFRLFIEQGIILANKSGYTQRGPVRLYLDMLIIFGVDFEQDSLFQWLKIEREDVSQIEKSISLYTFLNKYFDDVYGENSVFFKDSLEKFLTLNVKDLYISIGGDNKALHEFLQNIYQQRYDFYGPDFINNLIASSEQYCKRYGLIEDSYKSYLILIMFLFGRSLDQDLLRRWFIMEPLTEYFKSGNVIFHYSIASCYEAFKVNNNYQRF